MMRHSSILAFTLIIATILLWSCSGQKNYRKGIQAVEIGEYHESADRLRKAYKKIKEPQLRMQMAFNIAKAYHQLGEYNKAGIWYKNAYRRAYPDPNTLFYAAESYRAAKKINAAKELYEEFLEQHPNNERALVGIANCDSIKIWEKNPTRYLVSPLKRINSRYSDYAAIYPSERGNLILFSSMREHEQLDKSISKITGQRFSNIFQSSYNVRMQRWETPTPLNNAGAINTLNDEGTPCYSPQGDIILFTRCSTDNEKAMGASIYSSAINRGNFSEAINLALAPDSLIAAHPYFSMTGDTIFFTSNQAGGYGGLDIWMTTRKDDGFSKPINMGADINTAGNEVFPTTDWEGNLYFSSDYHTGLGGLDIYSAKKTPSGQWQVHNMKAPINSAGDDFSMSFLKNTDHPKGLFTSSRQSNRKDDIYSFELPNMSYVAQGIIINKKTEEAIDNVRLRVIGTDGTSRKMRAINGEFNIKLNAETEYIIAAYKDKYLNDKVRLNTIGLDDSKLFKLKLALSPIDEPIRIDNINYAFGSAELEESSKTALDTLTNLLNANPSITIELMAHTDHIGSEQANSILSQKRAQSVVNYLIEEGINPKRLVAKGYGETWPKVITKEIAQEYPFLKAGNALTEALINTLSPEEQEIAKSLNRRTEFRVLSTDFAEDYTE